MEEIEAIRRAVEVAVNRKMSVYSDFKWLSQKIYDSTHEQVSYMTLMRVWGYVGSGGVSKGTLNILAHYLGYMSYEDFEARETTASTDGSEPSHGDTISTEEAEEATAKNAATTEATETVTTAAETAVTEETEAVTEAVKEETGRTAAENPAAAVETEKPDGAEAAVETDAPVGPEATTVAEGTKVKVNPDVAQSKITLPNRTMVRLLYGVIALLLAIVGWGAYAMMNRQEDDADEGAFILHKGECFASYEDYLPLFGITNVTEHPWSQPLPHHNGIIVFGGQYKHPQWGNLGDSTNLLPTRTEYWHNDSLPPEVGAMMIREHYYVQKESNRLITTFMKDLVDTCFVFCGVYRMSLEQSDTTHVVWERVADRLDLRHLEYLEQLRN